MRKHQAYARKYWLREIQTRYGMLNSETVAYTDLAKVVDLLTKCKAGDADLNDKHTAADYLSFACSMNRYDRIRFSCAS